MRLIVASNWDISLHGVLRESGLRVQRHRAGQLGVLRRRLPVPARLADFGGELFLGHLRYGTSGGYNLSACHPYFRRSPWATRNLALCGNFNLTNTAELNQSLIEKGQHPVFATDTQAILEKIGFFLDEEHEDIYRYLRTLNVSGDVLSRRISEELDLVRVLTRASQRWDGGYVLCGLVGRSSPAIRRGYGRATGSRTTRSSRSPPRGRRS